MKYQAPGRHKDFDSFREHWQRLAREIDGDFDAHPDPFGPETLLASPFSLGDRTIGNRFCIHPMEGWDGSRLGLPSELTLRRWQRFGQSGAKLIWGGEAFAVRADGRANPNQLHRNSQADWRGALVTLRETLVTAHSDAGLETDDLLCGLQLTHSGRFARPDGRPAPRAAQRNPVLDDRFAVRTSDDVVSDTELESIFTEYVEVAHAAHEAGFDFVDVKCCHGYLLHELLGAHSREGRYGGSYENRTRFVFDLIETISRELPDLRIGVRISLADVFPHDADADGIGAPLSIESHTPYHYGFGIHSDRPLSFRLDEPLRFLQGLFERGVRLFNVSVGSPYYCPHLQRPATYPPSDGYQPPRDPLFEVFRHLELTRACKQAFPEAAVVGSGYSYLQEWIPHVALHELERGGVDFCGLGRMVLSYPELPRDVLAGGPLKRKLICRTFSDCTTGPRHGLVSGCYPLDETYKNHPEARELARIKRERREEQRS